MSMPTGLRRFGNTPRRQVAAPLKKPSPCGGFLLSMMRMKPAQLLYENGPDWRYATGTQISDPALWYQSPKGVTHIVVSELEIGLMRKTAKVDKIHAFGDVRAKLKGQPLTLDTMLRYLTALEKNQPDAIEVPNHFPAGLFGKLKEGGQPLVVANRALFFEQRALKTADEIKKLKAAQKLNEQAFELAFGILAEAKIRKADAVLMWQGAVLTSEILQGEMNGYLARHGAEEFHHGPVVAGGMQGAMPHARGNGPLKAHEFIVIDCFPKHPNGYWGDLTRTVLKGKPRPWHHKVYNAVLDAQKTGLKMLKPGLNGKDIHAAVVATLEQHGFTTGTDKKGNPYGMFHGTGHGVGLELHDPGPRTISSVDCILKPGMVTSVEPGLYYTEKSVSGGIGGCRIEDVVVITETGHKNLTTLSKADWIIK
ncbi:MAG: aminopeptidase P family protein [Blastochloris viridis]|uniref:Aminopeptidase P family protein n=1 Tax=Blastochloris viridis TaxID=1079 RepID=A0A6N4RCN2_BLAVI|nr:MAG: aminopeptidase P family protein [Blastochloris viridis]